MKQNSIGNFFGYSRGQHIGIIVLVILIVSIQCFIIFQPSEKAAVEITEDTQWMALQSTIDSIKFLQGRKKHTIYPFNPNFITDYKGYKLGMSVAEIDRLFAFRKLNKYANSAAEFQQVTKISDSLLATMSPYFKFPDWVTSKQKGKGFIDYKAVKVALPIIDINLATKEELIKVRGIGDALSDRIIKFRESLGGIVNMDQIADVYGLQPEVVDNVKTSFKVKVLPSVKKIKINEASVKELAAFPYFRWALAKEIVTARTMNGDLKSVADLAKINGFPTENSSIIALYLEF